VVVDCIEGARVQTETVIRQALGERIRPVLHVNKVDRAILELSLSGEDLYRKLAKVIDGINVLFGTYEDDILGDVSVDPRKGNVSFGSGKQGWAFTLPVFAKFYSENPADQAKMVSRLWGENYWDPESRKFYDVPQTPTGKPLTRYAVQMIFDPLVKVFNSCKNNDFATLDTILPKIGVKLAKEERELRGGDLTKKVMKKWLPVADTLTRLVVENLPSPKVAQQYRVENLYTGPLDDECATAIRNCDPNGPLNIFISKMIDPVGDGKRFYAFGRVFSGTVKPQQEVRILGPNYVFGEKSELTVKKIPGTQLFFGPKIENVSFVPCGNTVGISGLEKILTKSGTISTSQSAYPIAPMKFSVAPVVRRSVAPLNTANLVKFTETLKRLEHVDPCLQVIMKNKEFIIAGAGEFHIEVAIGELRKMLGDEIPFKVNPPTVEYCETVTSQSSVVCLAKSPNNLNRLFVTAEPISEELCIAIEKNLLEVKDPKIRAKQLSEQFGWDKNEVSKIWFWKGSNVIVNMSTGISFLNEIKDHVKGAFEEVVSEGILCAEPLRGVRFNLHDAKLHSDSVHRGPGQIIPAAKKVFWASFLAAKPALVEPYFMAEIETENKTISKVYTVVTSRRGSVQEQIPKNGTPLSVIKAHLPVERSFGFDALLREATAGYGFLQLMFSHWEKVTGDPFQPATIPFVIVKDVRKRKELKEELPTWDQYNDKL